MKISKYLKAGLMHFLFDENQLISYLCSFAKYLNNKSLSEEDKGLIAEYVMNKQDNFYQIKGD